MMFMFEHLKNSHINWLQIGPTNKLDIGTWYISVRGMQYILNMAVNAKISEGLIQKLSFEGFRIWPLVLWPLWEDFEKLAFAEEYL